jgi:hypothetical protein
MPAKAGIQVPDAFPTEVKRLDSRFRGNDKNGTKPSESAAVRVLHYGGEVVSNLEH